MFQCERGRRVMRTGRQGADVWNNGVVQQKDFSVARRKKRARDMGALAAEVRRATLVVQRPSLALFFYVSVAWWKQLRGNELWGSSLT